MADARAWRVDVHHHFYPPDYLRAMDDARHGEGAAFPGVRQWTTQRTLEEMDKHGVATAVVSLSPPGARMYDDERNRRLARTCNEYAARMAADHPGRFGQFAVLPMPDVDGALAEIDHAYGTLNADGIQLMTSYGDKWLGDPAFEALYAELNRRQSVVFVHPLAPNCCMGLMDWVPAALVEYPHDTNRAIVSLMFSGTLAKYPDIRWIFSHGGGAIPMLAGRIVHSGSNRRFLDRVPKGIDYELKKLHYETAIAAFKPSLSALFALVPMTQVLFGSDFPFSSPGLSVTGLASMGLAEADARAIGRGNAERLIPRLAKVMA